MVKSYWLLVILTIRQPCEILRRSKDLAFISLGQLADVRISSTGAFRFTSLRKSSLTYFLL